MKRISEWIKIAAVCMAVLLAAVAPGWAQSKISVFIITDAEGVAGVCRADQTDPNNAEMRQLLTGEINAAVEGFLKGGAGEVIVWDGHDGSSTLSALTIHPRAKLFIGNPGVRMTFDRHYSALAFVGQHARAGTPGAAFPHSYSSLGTQNMLMNGKPVGEIETRAALAGWYNTPVIFLSGDQAAADDLHAVVPDAELAVVKEGLSFFACISLSSKAAQALIQDAAQRAMSKIRNIRPYRIDGPVTIQIERTSRNAPSVDAAMSPGAERIDARTVRYHGSDFLEAWVRSQLAYR